jgi:DNA-binding NtrC family response regulator
LFGLVRIFTLLRLIVLFLRAAYEFTGDIIMATILLIEDDTPLLRLYEGALLMDHQVVTAESVAAARQAIEKNRPDLVILDLHLPDAPGTTILDYLRSQRHLATVQVIIMTGFNDYKESRLPEGIIGVLSKPVTVSTLRRRVDEALAEKST